MNYKKYDMISYNLYNIKLDTFKKSRIEVNFRNDVNKEDYLYLSILANVLSFATENNPREMDMARKCEDLYKLSFGINAGKVGQTAILTVGCDFLNPIYVNEDNYVEEIIKFVTDAIFHPLVKDNAFDNNVLDIMKNDLLNCIDTINESPIRIAQLNAFNNLDEDSPTRIFIDNYTKDDIMAITKENLYAFYHKFLEHYICDVIITGNLDFDKINPIFKKYFNLKTIKNHDISLYYDNIKRKKVLEISDDGKFKQSTLLILYNLIDLTENEKLYTINLFDYIFCNGGFKSKLFKKLREEKSLCYGVSSFYLKFDKMYGIKVSLAKKNIKEAKKIIVDSLKEMSQGIFDDNLLDEAKKSMTNYLKTSKDNIYSYSNQCLLSIIDNFPSIDERIIGFNKITKEEVSKICSKIMMNMIYILKDGLNEED